jgi:hypothetical protein
VVLPSVLFCVVHPVRMNPNLNFDFCSIENIILNLPKTWNLPSENVGGKVKKFR